MRFDVEDQVCEAQAFTGAATVSEHSIQQVAATRDPSIGRRMAFTVMPTVAAGAGSTVNIKPIQADNTALTTNKEDLSAGVNIPAAEFILGSEHEIPIPQGSISKLHLGIEVTITGGTTTATLDAYFVPQDEIPKYKSFPKTNLVSV